VSTTTNDTALTGPALVDPEETGPSVTVTPSSGPGAVDADRAPATDPVVGSGDVAVLADTAPAKPRRSSARSAGRAAAGAGKGAEKVLGHVSFVGAGPGDPGLLTIRAVDLIAAADVVVLDQSSREDLVARHARDGVEVLDAAFGDDGAPLARAARAKLIVRAAKTGGRVVRLMDGDPTTFTGLMDEIAACRKAGIGFDVVPGVSAVVAVPTYAGVPMTTPQTSSVNIVHPQGRALDWSRHADKDSTLVVLGGGDDIAAAALGLLAAGRNPATPVALTSHGTTTTQTTTTTVLADLERVARGMDGSPTTAVVGDVVSLREQAS